MQGLTAQIHTEQSIDAVTIYGYGEINSIAVISPLWPSKKPIILLDSKS
jgi:hypothetical protein